MKEVSNKVSDNKVFKKLLSPIICIVLIIAILGTVSSLFWENIQSIIHGEKDNLKSFVIMTTLPDNINSTTEGNNSFEKASKIDLNTEYMANLESNEPNWFVFTLPRGGYVNYSLKTINQYSKEKYWCPSLHYSNDPDGFFEKNYLKGTTTEFISDERFLEAGDYYFEMEPGNKQSSDIYRFTVFFQTKNEIEINDVENEDNNSHEQANRIYINREYSGNLSDTYENGEEDWYIFSLQKSGYVSYTIKTVVQYGDEAYWNPSLRKADSPDDRIVNDYISGQYSEYTSNVEYLKAGNYYFEIESSRSYSSDNYKFIINYSENDE